MFLITQGIGGPAGQVVLQGFGSESVPATDATSDIGTILLAMVGQLVSANVLPSTAIGLSLTKQPSSNIIGNSYITITPGREQAIEAQAYGIGRWGSGFYSTAWVNIYSRMALDVAYQDTYFLNGANGLRSLVFAVTNALQLFLPVDDDGNALTEEPIRILGNPKTIKYRKSPEWGYLCIPFQVRYAKSCDTSILY